MSRPPSHLFYQSRLRRPEVARARGIYLWDRDGRRYLDGSSGAMVVNLGHSDPEVLDAMRAQMEKATFAYRLHFENAPAEELARRLAGLMPTGLDRVFFVSGGSEAVESALKLARQYMLATGQATRYKVISRFPSYHGSSLGALAVTGTATMSAPFAPMMVEMPKIPAPTVYLDRHWENPQAAGLWYADQLEAEILRQGPSTVMAFIMEPVGGASTGALVAPDSYYPRIREICDRYGILLIYDEVMTGAGRTGRFLGADHWPPDPDLITLSKGLASGYAPLGALIARDRVVEAVLDAGGFVHGFTYAGNPLCCAAGLAVVNAIEQRALAANARAMGERLRDHLISLKGRFPFIGDVRGLGLLLAFEVVTDPVTMEPLPADLNAHSRLVETAYRRGLIIYSRRTRGGHRGDHFMVCPPLIIDADGVDELASLLEESLAEFAAELRLPLEAAP